MFKMDLEKAEEPEIKLLTSAGSLKKQENTRKTYTSALLIMTKLLTVYITTDYGQFFKRWEYQTTVYDQPRDQCMISHVISACAVS